MMTEPADKKHQNISHNLKTFIRGLTQNNFTEIYEGYKALFLIGDAAIPQIRDAISKSNWSTVKYQNEIRYVSGLVNLIHDIDESEAKQITNQLKQHGCSQAVAHILDAICSFTLADYTYYDISGVRIFEHKKLATRQNVRARLENWLKNVPSEDLKEIEHIFVLRREDLDSLGNYEPILYRINLVWENLSPRWNPMSWINNFVIESTLYHEVGHHVYRHTFGQDPDQEQEADKYSNRIMAHSSHVLFRIGRLIRSRSNRVKKAHNG